MRSLLPSCLQNLYMENARFTRLLPGPYLPCLRILSVDWDVLFCSLPELAAASRLWQVRLLEGGWGGAAEPVLRRLMQRCNAAVVKIYTKVFRVVPCWRSYVGSPVGMTRCWVGA